MSAKIYVLTRFSVYNYPPKIWPVGGKIQSEEEYAKWLYNPKRMINKFDIFEGITKRCIENQTYKNFEWHIYTSKRMPKKWLDELFGLVKDVPQAKLFYVKNIGESLQHFAEYPKKEPYVSVRLDDDDGIHPRFFEILSHYTSPGMVISPKHGRMISRTAPTGAFVSSYHTIYPFCGAWGLAFSGGNVYSLGNHMKVNSNYDVNYLKDKDLYLLYSGSKASHASGNEREHQSTLKPFDLDAFLKGKNAKKE